LTTQNFCDSRKFLQSPKILAGPLAMTFGSCLPTRQSSHFKLLVCHSFNNGRSIFPNLLLRSSPLQQNWRENPRDEAEWAQGRVQEGRGEWPRFVRWVLHATILVQTMRPDFDIRGSALHTRAYVFAIMAMENSVSSSHC
jgi:hypothetical protein